MKKRLVCLLATVVCLAMTSCIWEAMKECMYDWDDVVCYARFSGAESVGIKYVAYLPLYTVGDERPSDSGVGNYYLREEGSLTGPEMVKRLATRKGRYAVTHILWLREDLSIAATWDLSADTADAANRWLDSTAWITDTVHTTVCNDVPIVKIHHTFTFRPEDVANLNN